MRTIVSVTNPVIVLDYCKEDHVHISCPAVVWEPTEEEIQKYGSPTNYRIIGLTEYREVKNND